MGSEFVQIFRGVPRNQIIEKIPSNSGSGISFVCSTRKCGGANYLPQLFSLSCIHTLWHVTLQVFPLKVEGTSLSLWSTRPRHVGRSNSVWFLSLALLLLPRVSTCGREQSPIYKEEPCPVGAANRGEFSSRAQVNWPSDIWERNTYCCIPLRFCGSLLHNNSWLIHFVSVLLKKALSFLVIES